MYIIHPVKCIYLANPRTGSTTMRKFLLDKDIWKPGEVEVAFDNVSPGTKDKEGHKWGEHHGIDPKVMDHYVGLGYERICVVRNPWEHMVSWYHIRARDFPFEEFARDFDKHVFYTLPEKYPHTVQVHLHWSDRIIKFDGFAQWFEDYFNRGSLGWHHSSGRRKPYREYYDEELESLVARRYATEIDMLGFEY